MPNTKIFGIIFLFIFLLCSKISLANSNNNSYGQDHSLETLLNKSKNNSYFKTNIRAPDITNVECLAFMIYGEARGESLNGKLGVAFVVYNRSKKYNKTFCEIILQPGQFHFSIYKPKRIEEMKNWESILSLSFHLIKNEQFSTMTSPVGNALYFRNNSGKTFPRKKYIKTIGHHHFYK